MAEGSTEQKLLPIIFDKIKGYTLSFRKVALVNLGGSGSTANALKILGAIGIPAKALVDLDYAFRVAVKVGQLDDGNEDISSCRMICSRVASEYGFTLASDGVPQGNENILSSCLSITRSTRLERTFCRPTVPIMKRVITLPSYVLS